MNAQEKEEIEGYLRKIGKILSPMIQGLSDENGNIFRAHLEQYHYGPFLESYLDMLSFLNPELGMEHTLTLVPKSEDA